MGKIETAQMQQILLKLSNINDNLRKIEENTFEIAQKLSNGDNRQLDPMKHLVVVKVTDKK